MKLSRCLAVTAILLLSQAGCTNPSDADVEWPFSGFSEIRAYRFNWDDPNGEQGQLRLYNERNGLNPNRIPKEGVRLNDQQVARLKQAVCSEHARSTAAACFWPHHGFLFLDEQGRIVGSISICFLCDNYEAYSSGFAKRWDLQALKALFEELGMPISNPDWPS